MKAEKIRTHNQVQFRNHMKVEIKVYQVLSGDCMFISCEDQAFNFSLIVDAGIAQSYHRTLKQVLKTQNIDLFILTHTDDDHIKGMTPLISEHENPPVNKFLFNYSPKDLLINRALIIKKSIPNGIKLRDYLLELGKVEEQPVVLGDTIKFEDEITIEVLSPSLGSLEKFINKWKAAEKKLSYKKSGSRKSNNKNINDFVFQDFKDFSKENGSSIAFLLKFKSFKALFLGDAHHEIVVEGLKGLSYDVHNKLSIDYCKLSHHGSKSGISQELLETIECENYIISSNGSKKGSINKETLARIVKYRHPKKTTFFFNYDNEITRNIFSEDDEKEYEIISKYPVGNENFIRIIHTENERAIT